jgi:hypothetical protein
MATGNIVIQILIGKKSVLVNRMKARRWERRTIRSFMDYRKVHTGVAYCIDHEPVDFEHGEVEPVYVEDAISEGGFENYGWLHCHICGRDVIEVFHNRNGITRYNDHYEWMSENLLRIQGSNLLNFLGWHDDEEKKYLERGKRSRLVLSPWEFWEEVSK